MPSGARARPTAAAEAEEYYRETLRLPFPGLPEGSTWRGAFKHGTAPERTAYYRARFRGSSLTAYLLRLLAG